MTKSNSAHDSNDTKIAIFYNPAFDHPTTLDQRWKHTTEGFRAVGTFVGTLRYRIASTLHRYKSKIAPLSKLMRIKASDTLCNVVSLQVDITRRVVDTMPNYMERVTEPTISKKTAAYCDQVLEGVVRQIADVPLLEHELNTPETEARVAEP